MAELLNIQNISKDIKQKKIIKNFSFSMEEGEIVGLLGANGAGKTTIMRMIVGLIKITKGDIYIDGKSIQDNFLEAIAHVGAVIESPELYPYLTGYENLLLLSRVNGKHYKDNIPSIVKLVQLEERIHDKVKTYSLGMRQRLGVAQALIHNPKLIVLDEPLNGLDPIGVNQLREYLKSIAKEKMVGILISSHILSEIELLCDRVVVINKGEEITQVREHAMDDYIPLSIKTTEVQKASEILCDYTILTKSNNQLMLQINEAEIPALVRKLVDNHINIYELSQQHKSLEDHFIEIMKEANDE